MIQPVNHDQQQDRASEDASAGGSDERYSRPSARDRVLAAMQKALDSLVKTEIARIDRTFETAERVLGSTYDGYETSEIPADMRAVMRDMRIRRDKYVDSMLYHVTEDFRLAMELVEWALDEKNAVENPVERRRTPRSAKTQPEREEPASPPQAPAKQPKQQLVREPPPYGLSDTEQRAVLEAILAEPLRTAEIREKLDITKGGQALKRFLRWCRHQALVKTSGQKFGMRFSGTRKLEAYLSDE